MTGDPAAGPAPAPYEALRHRDFRHLWAAQLLSLVGTQMQLVALNWHVYLLTRSPLALGAVGLTRAVPILIFSLWGGVVADRHDRRKVMLAAQTAMTLLAAVLCALTAAHRESLAVLYAVGALLGAAASFDNPARQALIPRLVPARDLQGALALNITAFHAAMIGGPGLAGLVLAGAALVPGQAHPGGADLLASRPHLAWIYGLNAVSFLGVIAVLVTMRTSGRVEAPASGHAHPLLALREGLRFVLTTPIMVWTTGLDFFATFFSGSMSLLPVFADQVLRVGAAGYGWLAAAPAAGALLGSLYTSLRPLPLRQGRVFLAAVAAYGAATVVYGLSSSYLLTLLALAGTGLADVVSTVIRQTLRQVITPDHLRGRMTSVNMIFFMGGPQLGEMEAGLVASLFASAALGVRVSVISGGIATVLCAAVVAGLAPLVREYGTAAPAR